MKWIRKVIKYIFIICVSCMVVESESVLANDNMRAANMVIVLDPGHDDTHAGAQREGLGEEDLVLRIAESCKKELEKYAGVIVQMTRNSEKCANTGSSITSKECNQERVKYAESVNADTYVSFHINSSTSTSANGVGVYYPNENYRPELGKEGYGLATKILDELMELGLNKWSKGVLIRNSEDNTLYPDGSLADYLGIIRMNKEANIPSVLIEHGFISNSSDRQNFLSTDEKLEALGKADAKAIASYYNLTYGNDYIYDDATVTCAAGGVGSIFAVYADNIPDAYGVKFAVWSIQNDQDDLVWYTAKKTEDGRWIADVLLENHKDVGQYAIHTFTYKHDGILNKVKESCYDVSNQISGSVSIQNVNTVSGYFDVVISDVVSYGGINAVKVPVWSDVNQSDIQWYDAVKQLDGTYRVHVDVANHNCNFNNYQVHVYVSASDNKLEKLAEKQVNLSAPTTEVKVNVDENAVIKLNAWHVPGTFGQSLKEVSFAVWNGASGQDDLRWYKGDVVSDSFIANVPLKNHSDAGDLIVHAYAEYKNGNKTFVGSTVIPQGTSVEKVEILNPNTVTGSFDVVVSGVTSSTGVKQVLIPVWSKGDQSDIVWYQAQKQIDGTYRVHVDVANHNCNYGLYQAHVYVVNGMGAQEFVGMQTLDMNPPSTVMEWGMNADATKLTVSAWHVPGTFGQSLKKVTFAVWSIEGGQDDLRWYEGAAKDDRFVADVQVSNHNAASDYCVHIYAEYSNGKKVCLNQEVLTIK